MSSAISIADLAMFLDAMEIGSVDHQGASSSNVSQAELQKMLEKNLERAIYISQDMKSRMGSEASLNPATETNAAAGWSKSFSDSTSFSIQELIDHRTGANEFGTDDNAFFELRTILTTISQEIERQFALGKRLVRFIIQDPKAEEEAVLIEAFSVTQKAQDGSALIAVRHARHGKEDLSQTGTTNDTRGAWTRELILEIIAQWQQDACSIGTRHRSTLRLAREFLRLNNRVLAKPFKTKVEQEGCGAPGMPGAGKFKASFLHQMRPIPPASRKLFDLCSFCKKETAGCTCNGCGVTSYCSKACQTKDFKEHRKICKASSPPGGPSTSSAPPPAPLPDGDPRPSPEPHGFSSPVTIDMRITSAFMQGMHASMMSNQGQGVTPVSENAKEHSGKLFVIKAQVPPDGRSKAPILIYDQKRSFNVMVGIEQLEAYKALVMAVRAGGLGVPKVYLNAKRDGEHFLIVDTTPPANQTQFRW